MGDSVDKERKCNRAYAQDNAVPGLQRAVTK